MVEVEVGQHLPQVPVLHLVYSISNPVTDFTLVNLHSPWGIDSDGGHRHPGTWYYEYGRALQRRWPYPPPPPKQPSAAAGGTGPAPARLVTPSPATCPR